MSGAADMSLALIDENKIDYQEFRRLMAERLSQESAWDTSLDRTRLNAITNFKSIDKHRMAIKWQMQTVYELVMEIYSSEKRLKESLLTKRELVKYIHNFLLAILRRIRAFSLSRRLVDYLDKYYEFLATEERESGKKLVKIRSAFANCNESLIIKAENDEKLSWKYQTASAEDLKVKEKFHECLGKF